MEPQDAIATIFVGGLIYFLPWIVAIVRSQRNRAAIAVLNLLTGWTIIGWVGALVWACVNQDKEAKPPA